MKIFIYGFRYNEPGHYNISEKIVKRIPNQRSLIKRIFPARFNSKIFLNSIKKFQPDIILGLGQYPRGKKIRIERKTINLYRNNRKDKPKVIAKNSPRFYYLNLKLSSDQDSLISYSAGKYICNFSMYIISDYIKDRKIRFAFIHIPRDYDLDKVIRWIRSKIIYLKKIA